MESSLPILLSSSFPSICNFDSPLSSGLEYVDELHHGFAYKDNETIDEEMEWIKWRMSFVGKLGRR